MEISRRDLLKWASVSAVAAGIGVERLTFLEKALAAPGAPPVIWLQGASCSGCSVSLLNATSVPIETVLTQTVSMAYHPDLSAAYGEPAITSMFETAAANAGGFVLAVEGGVPVASAGQCCIIGERAGKPVTILDAIQELGPKAKRVLAVGTCAAFGGIVKPSKYTQVRTVSDALAGRVTSPVINLPGCPAHPDTVLSAIVDLITGAPLILDSLGRPTRLFPGSVHDSCPRRETEDAAIGSVGCYEEAGCHGPETFMSCPSQKWNGGRNWCIGANMACIGCASPSFPQVRLLAGESEGA
jgi:hydrogenase small subunit